MIVKSIWVGTVMMAKLSEYKVIEIIGKFRFRSIIGFRLEGESYCRKGQKIIM